MLSLWFVFRRRLSVRLATVPLLWMVVFIAAPIASWAVEDENRKAVQDKVDPDHAKKIAKGLQLFRTQVRSILVKRCLGCHGGQDVQSEFDLSTREDLLKGGSQGPAIKPGNPQQSRLYRLITHREQPHMPYEKKSLRMRRLS